MGFIDDIFTNKKKQEKEKLHQERQAALDANIDKSNQLQEQIHLLQKSNMEIAWKNEKLNEELVKLVAENDRTKNIFTNRKGIK
jgi:chromosome segregation ATPase